MSREICQWLWLAAMGLAFVTLFAEGMFRRQQARRPADGENKDREHLQTGARLDLRNLTGAKRRKRNRGAPVNAVARQLRAQIPSSTDPKRLEEMAQEAERLASRRKRPEARGDRYRHAQSAGVGT